MNSFLIKSSIVLLVTSGAIKTWIPGETVSGSDLNSALAHIHGKMVGGHGARLVNADVSASAAISFSKLEDNFLIPVAWGRFDCNSGTCSIISSSGVTSISRAGAGSYAVTLTVTRPDTNYMAIAWYVRDSAGGVEVCYASAIVSTSQVPIACANDLVPTTPTDSDFALVVFDNNKL